jgi:PAS domain S-box-containing protein
MEAIMSDKIILTQNNVKNVQQKCGLWKTYDASNGIPGGVWCLLQDRKGYLWIGTKIGLCRYDGTKFVTYGTEDGITTNDFMAVHEDSDGTLWFGTSDGLVRFDGERFTTYTTKDGLPENHIRALLRDQRGRLWIGTPGNGVSLYDGEKFINYNKNDGLPSDQIINICEDKQGQIWFATYHDGISCFDGERFINYNIDNGLNSNIAWTFCLDQHGVLWIGTSNGISCFYNNNLSKFKYNNRLVNKNIHCIYEDHNGRMWFGTLGGVSCFDGDEFINYTTEQGLLDNRVSGIIQGREGEFWFSHSFSGLTYFNQETSVTLTSEPVSESIIQDKQGRLWFSNENILHCLIDNQQFSWNFDTRIFSIIEDSKGNLWIGTFGDGLYRCSPDELFNNGKITRFTTEDGLGTNKIQGLLESKDGTIWVGTAEHGYLCRFDGIKFDSIITNHGSVFRIFEASHGLIWMGGWSNGGLSSYDGIKLKNYSFKDGLPNSKIQSILEDNEGNLWLGTQNGLCRFDGNKFVTYGKDYGIVSFFHQCSARDAEGRLWFGTLGGGLYYTDGNHFQWLTKDDGLPNNSIIGVITKNDGSIIVGTYQGIAIYRKTAIAHPEIEIKEIVTSQESNHTSETELTTVTSSIITISYHGLSFNTQRMLYSYILDGYDSDWHDTRETQVRYENLPIGKYTFMAKAINRDLVSSKEPAMLNIAILANPLDQLRSEYEAEIKWMQKILEINDRIHRQSTLSDSAHVIVESLREIGFDRAGVWFSEPNSLNLRELCGTDIDGNIYNNEDEQLSLDSIPTNSGYLVEMDRSILLEKLGVDNNTTYLAKGIDGGKFELVWGYPPPCTGYYKRNELGDNICISFTSEDKRIGIIAVDNNITNRNIDETSAHFLSIIGTKMAEVLTRISLTDSLRKSEEKYRIVVENAKEVIAVIQDMEIKYINSRATEITGYSRDELTSKSFLDFIHPDDRETVLEYHTKSLMGEESPYTYSFRVIDKYGNIRSAEVSIAKIIWEGEPAMLTLIDDITEKRSMETDLLRMQKLDSISVLAGGIAHDLNNLLSAVVGNVSLAEMYLQTGKPSEKALERLIEADKASSRIRDLTQQLLTFSKGGTPVKELTAIREIIVDSVNFAISGSNTKCIFDIPNDLWSGEVDTGQISQVINNIAINADQAMPDGGIIEIHTENIKVGIESSLPLKKGYYIKISIKDYGVGIPETIIQKIFDPFFTTKQKGSGLGLATSYSIIQKHNGYITVESVLGIGTTFIIYLPASNKQIPMKKIEEDNKYFVGNGRILLMDDEEYIIDVATEMLNNLGYKVVSSKDGAEAFVLYRHAKESGNPFNAVIMDLTVPGGMGGKELIQRLLEIDPKIKAIVSSGYSNDPIISDFKTHGFKGFITKPYKINEVSQILNKVLA